MTTPAPPSPRLNRLGSFFRELDRRSRVLAITGWIHLALLAGMLVISLFDPRLVTGINVWIKPIKFAVSIAVYVWTVAWLLEYLPAELGKQNHQLGNLYFHVDRNRLHCGASGPGHDFALQREHPI